MQRQSAKSAPEACSRLAIARQCSSPIYAQGCDWVCDFTEKGIVGAEAAAVPGEQAALWCCPRRLH